MSFGPARSAVVLGAGPAGALSALCLARRGTQVTVVDSDITGDPETWERKGARHSRQGHTFLALGMSILDAECPGIGAQLLAAGASRSELTHEPGAWNLLARRSLFDQVLREAIRNASGIRLLEGVGATDVLVTDSSAGHHVFGVLTAEGPITAEAVIDATGRRSVAAASLSRRGLRLPFEQDMTRFAYVTRHYRLRAAATFPSVRPPIVTALDYASVFAFPEDGGHFQITIQLDVRDPSRRALRDPITFEHFVSSVRPFDEWIAAGKAVGDPDLFASFGNARRRLVREVPLVTGLFLVGDAAMHTNPTAGRGVALAVAHARAVAENLCVPHQSPFDAAVAWENITSELLDPWLRSQVQLDREQRDKLRSELEHSGAEPRAPLADLANALYDGRIDDTVAAAGERLFNLLTTPERLHADRNLMRRLFSRRSRRIGVRPVTGPSRGEFEEMVKR